MNILEDNKVSAIKLIPLTEAHIADLEITCGGKVNSSMWQYLFDAKIYRKAGIEGVTKEILSKHNSSIAFGIYNTKERKIIGITRAVNLDYNHKSLEIYTWIGVRFQFQHFGLMTSYLLLDYIFSTLGFHRVQYLVDTRNTPSFNSLKSIGAVLEGVIREHSRSSTNTDLIDIRSSNIFSILSSEWPTVKATIENKLEMHCVEPNEDGQRSTVSHP